MTGADVGVGVIAIVETHTIFLLLLSLLSLLLLWMLFYCCCICFFIVVIAAFIAVVLVFIYFWLLLLLLLIWIFLIVFVAMPSCPSPFWLACPLSIANTKRLTRFASTRFNTTATFVRRHMVTSTTERLVMHIRTYICICVSLQQQLNLMDIKLRQAASWVLRFAANTKTTVITVAEFTDLLACIPLPVRATQTIAHK